MSFISCKDYNQADDALDKMLTDFEGNPDLPKTLLFIGEQCYRQGFSKEDEEPNQAKALYETAIKVWERLINELPDDYLVPEACRWVGNTYYRLGKYGEAINYFQKVIDDYPQYEYVWSAQGWMGECYKALRDSSTEPNAESRMGEAYRAVIEKYPECPFVERASLELAELAFKRSELAKAAEYLELYLERSWEDDPRIPKALYDLGRAYEQMGEMGLAAEVYRMFIEADPNNPLAESIKVKLGEMERASE